MLLTGWPWWNYHTCFTLNKMKVSYTAVWWHSLFFLTSSVFLWSQMFTIPYFCRILLWRIAPSAWFNVDLNYWDPGLKLLHIVLYFQWYQGNCASSHQRESATSGMRSKNRKQMWQKKKNLIVTLFQNSTFTGRMIFMTLTVSALHNIKHCLHRKYCKQCKNTPFLCESRCIPSR